MPEIPTVDLYYVSTNYRPARKPPHPKPGWAPAHRHSDTATCPGHTAWQTALNRNQMEEIRGQMNNRDNEMSVSWLQIHFMCCCSISVLTEPFLVTMRTCLKGCWTWKPDTHLSEALQSFQPTNCLCGSYSTLHVCSITIIKVVSFHSLMTRGLSDHKSVLMGMITLILPQTLWLASHTQNLSSLQTPVSRQSLLMWWWDHRWSHKGAVHPPIQPAVGQQAQIQWETARPRESLFILRGSYEQHIFHPY